jgi:hypothetical protein
MAEPSQLPLETPAATGIEKQDGTSSRRCATCRHWVKTAPGEAIRNACGQCRGDTPKGNYTWPKTHESDWCAKWQAIEEKDKPKNSRGKSSPGC